MDLAPKITNYTGVDRRWLRSRHGQDTNKTVHLSGDLFDADVFPNLEIPSGVTIGVVTATGLAGPYDDDATDGRQTNAGHLLNDEKLTAGRVEHTVVVRHGVVDTAHLPTNHGLDAAGKADLPQIDYR